MTYTKTPKRLSQLTMSQPLYFVTTCIHDRRPLLDNNTVYTTFEQYCQASLGKNVAVGRYVIMPDHIHLFVRGPVEFALGNWVGRMKQKLTQAIWSDLETRIVVWQRGFFDHVLRSDESYAEKWQYVVQNPVRAKLVDNSSDWPYQGEYIRIDRA